VKIASFLSSNIMALWLWPSARASVSLAILKPYQRLSLDAKFQGGVIMQATRYRIKSSNLGLFTKDGSHVARTVPAGSLLTIDGDLLHQNQLVEVLWNDKKVMMFAQDVRARGEKID
jgi:hypothetical protein